MTDHSSAQHSALQVPCPACRKAVTWTSTNAYRPFCSERCKTADFIAWANEEQAITGDDAMLPPAAL